MEGVSIADTNLTLLNSPKFSWESDQQYILDEKRSDLTPFNIDILINLSRLSRLAPNIILDSLYTNHVSRVLDIIDNFNSMYIPTISDGIESTPTSGRKFYFTREVCDILGFKMRGAVNNSGRAHILSLKGTGSQFKNTTQDSLKNESAIIGFTSLTNDHEIENLLTEDLHLTQDIYGNVSYKRFVCGREFLFAIELDHILLANGKIISLNELSQDLSAIELYPLALGKNRLYAIFHLNYTNYNFKDIQQFANNMKDNNIIVKRDKIIKLLKEIRNDLRSHPYFFDMDLDEDINSTEFCTSFISQIILRHSDMNYTNSQISNKLGVEFVNRHLHNEAFGPVDFEDARVYKIKPLLLDDIYETNQSNLFSMIRSITQYLTFNDKKAIIKKILIHLNTGLSKIAEIKQDIIYDTYLALDNGTYNLTSLTKLFK